MNLDKIFKSSKLEVEYYYPYLKFLCLVDEDINIEIFKKHRWFRQSYLYIQMVENRTGIILYKNVTHNQQYVEQFDIIVEKDQLLSDMDKNTIIFDKIKKWL